MKNYWRTDQLEKNKKTFPNQIVTDNEVIDDAQKICEAFNFHFATVGEHIGKHIKFHNPLSIAQFPQLVLFLSCYC